MKHLILYGIILISSLLITSCAQESSPTIGTPGTQFIFKSGYIHTRVDGEYNSFPSVFEIGINVIACPTDRNLSANAQNNFKIGTCDSSVDINTVYTYSYLRGMVDTKKTTFLSLEANYSYGNHPPLNGHESTFENKNIKMTNVRYTDYLDSLVIYYSGEALKDIHLVAKLSRSRSAMNGSYDDSFTSFGEFSKDNFIKMVLYRK